MNDSANGIARKRRPGYGPSPMLVSENTPHGARILKNATGGEIVAEFLIHWNIPYVFGLSGSEEVGLWDALVDRESSLAYITCLHEQIAMAMADGYARASGQTPLVALHSIAGAAYAFGQMIASYRDRVPVVVTVGHQATDFRGHDGFLESPNLHVFPQSYTQWTWDVMDAATIAATLRRAVLLAEAPPGGPTFITFSKDLFERQVAETEILPREKSRVARHVLPPPEHVGAIVDGLLDAERPLILLGNEAMRDDVSDEVMAICDLTGAMVVTSWEMSLCYPNNHASFAGTVLVQDAELLRATDALWSLGAHLFKRPRNEGTLVAREARIFHTGQDWMEVGRNYPVDSAALANIRSTAEAVLAELRRRDLSGPRHAARRQRMADYAAARRQRLEDELQAKAGQQPIALCRLFDELDRAIAPDANLVLEVVTAFDVAQDRLTIDARRGREERRHAYGTSSGVLGWGLPAAIGVALARPGRETWCLVGDGSANFAIQALWSAARYAAPIAYVIVNNGQYQANRMNMLRYAGWMTASNRYPGVSLQHPQIDFVALARGYGIEAEVVEEAEALAAALARAQGVIAQGRPYLLDVRVEGRFDAYDPSCDAPISIAELAP